MSERGGVVVLEPPEESRGPGRRLAERLAIAAGLVVFVTAVAYLARSGFADETGDGISLLDAFYYATVSITTTGYGDITPVTDTARLLTALLITPARVVFLVLLVGTTLEVLAESSRAIVRRQRWSRRLHDHTIICGYGTKGRTAIETLRAIGAPTDCIVVVDPRQEAVDEAKAQGFPGVVGDATRSEVLREAGVEQAASIVVATDRDDTAVLTTLTARQLSPDATIVAAVREEENRSLLEQSGADSVILSSGAAGRLLGFSTQTKLVVHVLEDLLKVGEGFDVAEQQVGEQEAGPISELQARGPILGVVRDGELIRFDDERAQEVRPGDRVVRLTTNDR